MFITAVVLDKDHRCYKHDICINRILTQSTLKCSISRAKFKKYTPRGLRPLAVPLPEILDPSLEPTQCSAYSHRESRYGWHFEPKIVYGAGGWGLRQCSNAWPIRPKHCRFWRGRCKFSGGAGSRVATLLVVAFDIISQMIRLSAARCIQALLKVGNQKGPANIQGALATLDPVETPLSAPLKLYIVLMGLNVNSVNRNS